MARKPKDVYSRIAEKKLKRLQKSSTYSCSEEVY